MMPSEIGRIAAAAHAKSVVLSHFMNRTANVMQETAAAIGSRYKGKLNFARDCDIYAVHSGEQIGSCLR